MQKTALYTLHEEAGAKFIDFFGWNMPLHYGSQIIEHKAVRKQSGVFDVSHMTIIDIEGEKARDFLQFLLANDVGKLTTSGKALYSVMLNEDGGVIDDVIAYYQTPKAYRLVTNAAPRKRVEEWLSTHAKTFGVTFKVRDELSMLAVQGPDAQHLIQQLFPENEEHISALLPFHSFVVDECWVCRTGYTGEDGFELMLPHEQACEAWAHLMQLEVQPVGLGARDSLRLEAGMLLNGQDMDEKTSPLSVNLNWTIAWMPEERDFVGRKTLAAQKDAGSEHCFVGVVLEDKGVLRPGLSVSVKQGHKVLEGQLTSGGFSPILGQSIGFARFEKTPQTNNATVTIREQALSVSLVKPRFVRFHKSIVEPFFQPSAVKENAL